MKVKKRTEKDASAGSSSSYWLGKGRTCTCMYAYVEVYLQNKRGELCREVDVQEESEACAECESN